jgi:hypothetical protein
MRQEQFRDKDIAETVVPKGKAYSLLGIHEGDLLEQAYSYVHPRLKRRDCSYLT